MTYFLDTNMCIYYLKGLNPRVKEVLLGKIPDEVKIPSVVKAELLFGAHKSRDTKNNTERVMEFGRIPGLRLENWSRQCSPPSP